MLTSSRSSGRVCVAMFFSASQAAPVSTPSPSDPRCVPPRDEITQHGPSAEDKAIEAMSSQPQSCSDSERDG